MYDYRTKQNPWIASSPEGVVYDPTYSSTKDLVEVKAPLSVKEMTIEEAHSMSKSFCLEKKLRDDGSIVFSLKK